MQSSNNIAPTTSGKDKGNRVHVSTARHINGRFPALRTSSSHDRQQRQQGHKPLATSNYRKYKKEERGPSSSRWHPQPLNVWIRSTHLSTGRALAAGLGSDSKTRRFRPDIVLGVTSIGDRFGQRANAERQASGSSHMQMECLLAAYNTVCRSGRGVRDRYNGVWQQEETEMHWL